MSLLRRRDSLDSLPDPVDDEDELEPYPAGWSKLSDGQDGINDSFADNIDDDDLSFEGIYDDEESLVYHQESPVRDGSPTADDNLPRLLSTLTIVAKAPTVSNRRSPHQQLEYFPGIDICIVCRERPPYSRNGKSFPTCGLTCAGVLETALNNSNSSHGRTPPRMPRRKPSNVANTPSRPFPFRMPQRPRPSVNATPHASSSSTVINTGPPTNPCVVCRQRPCHGEYVTCGLRCAEQLITSGSGDATLCTYCLRRPKLSGHNQCGKTCADAAKLACLLCKSRPKHKRYHLCGKSCKLISTKRTPLLLEAPEGHATWDLVQKKFDNAWKWGTKPAIKSIYKIIESKNFLQPYDQYKKKIGRKTEVFRYHGTSRKCTLGSGGNTMLCNDSGCVLCSILKTSFKTSLANPNGAFGAGVYSSSAANKAYSYSANGSGALILTKVVLGKAYSVNAFAAVTSCPAGYDSVVFDRNGGSLNETIVYSDDAIRPVFLIVFK